MLARSSAIHGDESDSDEEDNEFSDDDDYVPKKETAALKKVSVPPPPQKTEEYLTDEELDKTALKNQQKEIYKRWRSEKSKNPKEARETLNYNFPPKYEGEDYAKVLLSQNSPALTGTPAKVTSPLTTNASIPGKSAAAVLSSQSTANVLSPQAIGISSPHALSLSTPITKESIQSEIQAHINQANYKEVIAQYLEGLIASGAEQTKDRKDYLEEVKQALEGVETTSISVMKRSHVTNIITSVKQSISSELQKLNRK